MRPPRTKRTRGDKDEETSPVTPTNANAKSLESWIWDAACSIRGAMANMNLIYTSDDGRPRLDLRFEGQTVWLTQLEFSDLFQTTRQNVSLHAKNIMEDGALAEHSVIKDSLATAADGKR